MSIEEIPFVETEQPVEETSSLHEMKIDSDEYIQRMLDMGYAEHAEAYGKVLDLAESIKDSGGRAMLVGGSVRDALMGKVSKDFDMEIYGLKSHVVEEIVKNEGKVSEVGKAFGILKLFLESGIDIDVSLPRTDSKIGDGHGDFDVKTDENMGIEEAARRRDFTMNSLALDPLTGELYDPFGGVKDIKERKLRITDPEKFGEDSLRVLRALQFISRFGLEVDKDSIPVIQEAIPRIKKQSQERIREEWKKLLTKSEKPSLGLTAGMALGVLHEIHPELPPLADTPQEPEWHPEGDVWVHTLMTLDEAAKITRREGLEDDRAMTILLATLCHDLGKADVTEFVDGRIKSHGHEQAGEIPTKRFLAGIGIEGLARDKVVKLVTNHLTPTMFYIDEVVRGGKVSDGAVRRLAKRIHPATIQELVLVSEADHLGRGTFDVEIKEQLLLPAERFPAGEWLLERARRLDVEASRPADLTRGRDWLGFGYEAGPDIGMLIRLSNDLRDDKDFSREAVLQLIDGAENSQSAIKILKEKLHRERLAG